MQVFAERVTGESPDSPKTFTKPKERQAKTKFLPLAQPGPG
jgi:hypothetical protein